MLWQGVLLAMAAIALILGMVLGQLSLSRYAAEGNPKRPTWNPRNWIPFWRMRDRFMVEKGFRMFVASSILLSFGALLALIVFLVGS